uniref:Uncharacterized protein n=1 Tax=Anguilla anguilla TaxID=7936 RepID=A0A0E9X2C4_ANGAN
MHPTLPFLMLALRLGVTHRELSAGSLMLPFLSIYFSCVFKLLMPVEFCFNFRFCYEEMAMCVCVKIIHVSHDEIAFCYVLLCVSFLSGERTVNSEVFYFFS